MDIGDTVTFEGKRFSVRGFDPAGVEPRFVYLEDPTSGGTISVPFAELLRTALSAAPLHLVDDDEPS
jgi:hypothetical protein